MSKPEVVTELAKDGAPVRMWIWDGNKKKMITEIESKENADFVFRKLSKIASKKEK